jgi:hypothetical protein
MSVAIKKSVLLPLLLPLWLLLLRQVLVHTPLTVHAAELQQLYHGLTLSSLSTDERLDVLLHVKWVVREWDCAATRELLELIDREADLLNRCGC